MCDDSKETNEMNREQTGEGMAIFTNIIVIFPTFSAQNSNKKLLSKTLNINFFLIFYLF
jgi:hypothetical protein